ncbi:MAG: GTP-binding DUF697 domain-containing protein [Lachnospiraceae bacterium]
MDKIQISSHRPGQDDIVRNLFEKIKMETKDIVHPNIIVCGKTGVGKSTLINNVFREDLAETGIGRPVTQHLQIITKPDVPVTLYDTKGLELSEKIQKQIKEEIIDVIQESEKSFNEEEYIHAIWYCVNSGANRLEPLEADMIKELVSEVNVPVIIVMTQSFPNGQAKAFKSSVENMNLNASNVISVMAQDFEICEGQVIEAYGLDTLVEATYNILPESVQRGFINAQKANISAKANAAKKYANGYIASAFATGFSPIPCSDAPVLIGLQVTMIAHITSIFGLPVDEGFIKAAVSSILGSASATIAGKFIVSNLLKMIPVVGTAAGGIISGGTAALLTASIARAYIKIMVFAVKKSYEGKKLQSEEIFKRLKHVFEEELKKGTDKI